MRKKMSIPTEAIQALFHLIGELAHLARIISALRVVEHLGQRAASCDHSCVVAEEDAEVGLFKIDDHHVASGELGLAVAKEIPGIDGQPAFKQSKLLRPAIRVVDAVVHRVQRTIKMLVHPGIVARGLPHQV